MAYTYDDFLNAANKSGMMAEFSQDDLDRAQKHPEYGLGMLSIKRDYKNADNDDQRLLLNEAANQLKKSYTDLPTPSVPVDFAGTKAPFQYEKENEYKSLLDDTIKHGAFEWNVDDDPRWSSLRKSYAREGRRAQENAMAQAAASTGGVPSSYAVSAASQAGNYYASQLNDYIPKLYGEARKEYNDDFSLRLSKLDAMRKDRADKYNIWLDALNEAYRQDQAEKAEAQQKFQNALAFYRQFGYATPEVAEILGIPSVTPSSDSGGGGDYYYSAPPKKEKTESANKTSYPPTSIRYGSLMNEISTAHTPQQLNQLTQKYGRDIAAMPPQQYQKVNNAFQTQSHRIERVNPGRGRR